MPRKYANQNEKQKANMARWKIRDPEKYHKYLRERARRYRKKHPEYLLKRGKKYRDRRVSAIKQFGGECSFCGYEYNGKNAATFHFHHTDPSKKGERTLLSLFISSTDEELQEELKKCCLLCSNCHEIIHGGEF